ncbi:MAG: hypothetical protein EPO21_20920 [Chloroflexota bacterium]|nr:MAG: hypothetical protein EPO21_20920 [Chloroflexota bacterium]
MDWSFIILVTLGIVGVALLVGGAVAYSRSDTVRGEVLSAVAMAAGVVMWALLVYSTPVSVTREEVSPAPTPISESYGGTTASGG